MFAKIKNADILKRSAEIPKRGRILPICIYSRKSTFTKKYSKKKDTLKITSKFAKSRLQILPVHFTPSSVPSISFCHPHRFFFFYFIMVLIQPPTNHRWQNWFQNQKACENRLFSSIFLSMICFTDEIQF